MAAANTAFNTSQIDLDWQILRQPGMKCQSHRHVYRMLAVYNAVSVILSVVLATPYYYIIGLSKIYAAKPFKIFWRKADRRGREMLPGRDVVNADMTIGTLTLSTVGSVIIALAAPFLTAISLWIQHRQNVNLWAIVQQWVIRPRATCLLFPIHALMGNMNFKGRPHGWVITAATSLLAEIPLTLLSIRFVASQIRHIVQHGADAAPFEVSIPMRALQFKNLFDEMPNNVSSLVHAISAWMSLLGTTVVLAGIICLALYLDPVPKTNVQNEREQPISMGSIALYLWLPSIAIYGCSWALWHWFLILTPDDLYCVEDSRSIDIIYCLLPFVLASWRAVVMTASKRLPVKSFDASQGKSEAK